MRAEVAESLEIVAGIADVKAPPATADELGDKIDRLLDVVSPSRLLVSSSCGCGRCTTDAARALRTRLVEAAHRRGDGDTRKTGG